MRHYLGEPRSRSRLPLWLNTTIAIFWLTCIGVAAVPASPLQAADEFDCNFNLCDSSSPCNRGCTCTYPPDATVGYCRTWYDQNRSPRRKLLGIKPCRSVQITERADEGTQKKSYTCDCQDPCSGSITCENGCYAFCEENPQGSGRHVCVKGCASAKLLRKDLARRMLQPDTVFSRITLRMPVEEVLAVLARLFDHSVVATDSIASTAHHHPPAASEVLAIELTEADLQGILDAIRTRRAF